jgi:hypothetical protein
MNNSDLPALFADCLLFDFKSVLTSPSRLGSFLSLCKLLTGLEEEARHAAVALALRETVIPGWTLVRKDGHGYVEPGAVLELQRCPINSLTALLPAVSSALGSVSEKHYLAFCAAIGADPDPEAVKHRGSTVFLRQNNNQER